MPLSTIEQLEARRLLSAVVIAPVGSSNNFSIRENPDLLHIDVSKNSSGGATTIQSFLISSTTRITINGSTGDDTLTQNTAIPAPLFFNGGAGNDTLNINAGTYTLATNPAATTTSLTINDSGALYFTATALESGITAFQLASLNIQPGGSLMVDTPQSASDRAVLTVDSLSIASTGLLDLTGNDMIVHNGNVNALTPLIQQGYNTAGSPWKGSTGITSSLAAMDSMHLAALGILNNDTGQGTPIYPVFDGQTSSVTDVLIKYTLFGDADLNGKVDASDYSRIDSGFVTQTTGWANGNFNYENTIVDGSDYTLVDNAFITQPTAPAPALFYKLNNALDVAQEQARKTVANLGTTGKYPQYVNADGSLSLVDKTHWTAGTWPGLLWGLYQATGNPYYKTQASLFTMPLVAADTQTSDVGFRIYDSFFPYLQQNPGDSTAINAMLTAAASKKTTYNATVGAFEAWRTSTSGNPAANFNVLMDLIMDSQLLFWAAQQTGDQTYYNEAVSNAVIEENYLVHADGTSSQFAYFNSSNGAFVDNETYQGYSNTSTWARGEAWSIYGFAQVYAATGRADFLATSEKTADWFLAHLPADHVPYWDFNAPTTYRDTSAAAVAASGLLKLSALIATTDPANSLKYRNAAGEILGSLASTTYLADPNTQNNGVLLQGALNVPAGISNNSINFGDYYFIEAINEYQG